MTPTESNQRVERLNSLVSGREQRLIQRRPDPPVGLRLIEGSLTWEPPREMENVTHFNIYVGGELPSNLAASVPAVQRRIDGVGEASVFISSYDDRLRLESRRVKVVGTTAASGDLLTRNIRPLLDNTYALGLPGFNWTTLWTGSIESGVAAPLRISSLAGEDLTLRPGGVEAVRAFATSGAVQIGNPVDQGFLFYVEGTTKLNDETVAAAVFPDGNNTRDLGKNAARWKKIWGVDLDLSGGISLPAWTSYGPTVTTDATSVSVTTADCAYLQLGKLVLVRIALDANITGTGTRVSVTLPVTPVAGQNVQTLAACWGTAGVNAAFEASGNKVRVSFDNGASATGFGARLIISGSYEAA